MTPTEQVERWLSEVLKVGHTVADDCVYVEDVRPLLLRLAEEQDRLQALHEASRAGIDELYRPALETAGQARDAAEQARSRLVRQLQALVPPGDAPT